MTASTRRAALGAILAAPLTTVPAVAASLPLPDHEARFLALVPRLAALVPPLEQAKNYALTLAADADGVAGQEPGWDERAARRAWAERGQAERERNGDRSAWEAWNDRINPLDELVAPFMRQPMTTLRAIVWKARVACLLDCWTEEAGADLATLAREGTLCA